MSAGGRSTPDVRERRDRRDATRWRCGGRCPSYRASRPWPGRTPRRSETVELGAVQVRIPAVQSYESTQVTSRRTFPGQVVVGQPRAAGGAAGHVARGGQSRRPRRHRRVLAVHEVAAVVRRHRGYPKAASVSPAFTPDSLSAYAPSESSCLLPPAHRPDDGDRIAWRRGVLGEAGALEAQTLVQDEGGASQSGTSSPRSSRRSGRSPRRGCTSSWSRTLVIEIVRAVPRGEDQRVGRVAVVADDRAAARVVVGTDRRTGSGRSARSRRCPRHRVAAVTSARAGAALDPAPGPLVVAGRLTDPAPSGGVSRTRSRGVAARAVTGSKG